MTKDLERIAPAELERLTDAAVSAMQDGKSANEALADLFNATVEQTAPRPTAVAVKPITDEQRQALTQIVEVYGVVAPTEPRLLTADEMELLTDERDLLDEILTFAKERKDKGIREALANHFDRKAEQEGLTNDDTVHDAHGHYAIKQEQHVAGNGKKAQRIVSGGKPVLTAAAVQKAEQEGVLSRADYLAVTEVPEVPRVLSEHKMRKAIKKDPALAQRLAELMTPSVPTTSIKVG